MGWTTHFSMEYYIHTNKQLQKFVPIKPLLWMLIWMTRDCENNSSLKKKKNRSKRHVFQLKCSQVNIFMNWPKRQCFWRIRKKSQPKSILWAYLPVSKQIYPHFTKQPKMVTREMLSNKKFFRTDDVTATALFSSLTFPKS